MADFAAVLKKTIDAQANPDQGLRQRVYAKARSTIEQKLVAANASEAAGHRQRQLLETAIETVEADYRSAERALEEAALAEQQQNDPLEDFLKAVQQQAETSAEAGAEEVGAEAEQNYADEKSLNSDVPNAQRDEQWYKDRDEEAAYSAADHYSSEDEGQSGKSKKLIAGLIALLLIGGAAYAGWSYKEQIQNYISGSSETSVNDSAPDGEQSQAPSETVPDENTKLTQRLLEDGNEVDEGRADEVKKIGEGTSTTGINNQATVPNGSAAQTPATETDSPTVQAAIPVGQKAFFYEERSGQDASSSAQGNIVWSVIQDSPGDDLPDEPAIRADVSFAPDSPLKLRMTIRRNMDKSIPASHLIEMIYTVPDDFSGGVIENVQRVTFKDSEQAAGNPLVAIPMKIADNFFIVALNDARTAVDMNLSLMRTQQWLDIPIMYRNGRRALISVEKGASGDKVFDQVLKSWSDLAKADSSAN